ncbi:MAG: helix-turn-helix domain-containing protein [Actinobacteria bacterium]|nr:helix-turn-helix domain-containing protein [Actinomycetota bacterium]
MSDHGTNGAPDGFKLLTAEEVAEMLSVPERWVRDASREGRIPTVKLGRYRRFRRDAVFAWIEAREVEGRGRK